MTDILQVLQKQSCYQNRVLVSGPEGLVRKSVSESQDENSCFDFNKVKKSCKVLALNTEAASPYSDYVARFCLKSKLVHKQFELENMLKWEKELMAIFRDLKADEYVRGKAYFLNNYQDVTIPNFNSFYQHCKCFSKVAAYWNLVQCFNIYADDPLDLLDIVSIPVEEESYQKKEGKNFTRAEWEASKDVFYQLVTPSSQLFSEHRKNLWGVTEAPTESNVSYSHDGSALWTFNTVGGIPDKVIAALAAKYPGLTIIHHWQNMECPDEYGCIAYNKGEKMAA